MDTSGSMIPVNKYQTPITKELLDSFPSEVVDEVMDAINSVPLIQHLISPNRPLAKDCPRDEKGRIIVDLTNPPIIEDTDYFRPVALFYKEHGKMTNLRPNANPNSEFGKWIREEIRRIWYGYVRESDGAWVTGDMYFYLNYCPIIQSKIRKGTKIADRIVDTPEFWEGIWWRSNYIEQARNLGHHCAEIAKRGASKSYFVASILAKLFILGENEDTSKSVRAMVTAYQKEYLVKDGTLNKFVEMIDYIAQNTEFPSKRLRSSLQDMQWKMGYVDLDTGTQRGTLNEIIGVSSKDDPDKLRGKRSSRIIIEEFGNFPKVTDTYRVILPSVQEGNIVFGQMILIGTGGSEGADFAGANEIIYNPLGFNIYAIPNVYDRSAQGKNNTIFFFGAYVNRKGCYNHDGVSDVTKALLELCYDRYLVKYNTTDSMALTRTKAENPITLQEAIMRRDSTLFPVATIMDRIHQIDGNPNEYDDIYVGELELKKDGKVEFKPTSAQPIRHFPHKDNKLEGAVEIFKMPELDRDGKPFNGRYIASQDPYDDDSAETMSLGSTFILDLWTDKIVAEYTGRPMFADDYYETSRRMCLFYNARMNYENNKKGLFAYFSKMNCLYLLTDVLEFLKDKDMVKGQLYGNKAHPYSEKVYTPQGIKRWEDISIGDYLYGTNGKVTKVIDIPFNSSTSIYKITLKDGRKVRASGNHLWNVIDWNGYNKTLTTSQLISNYYRDKGKYREYKYYIPSNKGADFNSIKVKLPPYFMGIMLGDGCFTNSRYHQAYFTSSISDMNEYKNNIPFNYKTVDDRHHRWLVPNIGKILIEYGLQDSKSHTKFIPIDYKYNSREVRLELLQGLLDTDGHVGYGGNPEYVTVSEQLCSDIIEVARSLGINCNKQVHTNEYGNVYKVIFYTNIVLFKLPRKACKQSITKTRVYKTAIVNIEYVGEEMAKCVTVDALDSCYLVGDFITTHNSKGTNATTPINAYARTLIRNWLLKPVVTVQVVDGEEQEVTVPNLMFIKSKALLQELAQWNPDGNFDRVSSLGMLMLLREDKMITLGGDVSKAIEHNNESDLSNDKFFKKNYDLRFKKTVNLVK